MNSFESIKVFESKHVRTLWDDAQGLWFVPGGRVYKNEPLALAFKRLCEHELGKAFCYENTTCLGVFDHFYDDSIFGTGLSTHYINSPHLIKLSAEDLTELPLKQHSRYRWQSVADLSLSDAVHPYSKVFLPSLNQYLNKP